MNQDKINRLVALRSLTTLVHFAEFVMDIGDSFDLADQRRWWVRPINERRDASEQLVHEMRHHDDEEFFAYTRLSMEKFDELLLLVGLLIVKENTRADVLSPYMRLLTTLRYLATGESFASPHMTFRAGKSTIAKVVYETCGAIKTVLQDRCLPALTKQKLVEIAQGFKSRTHYLNVVGAIDGKHISIKSPRNSGTMFYNYKKTFSLVLLAACAADCRFTYVNIGSYGSESDGGIFRKSGLGLMLERNELPLPEPTTINNNIIPFYFLGDAAFPLRPYLMTPYSGRELEPRKFKHNKLLSNGRVCIENVFGILAARWQVFLGSMCIAPENADVVVLATVLLHNFMMMGDHRTYASAAFATGDWREIVEDSVRSFSLPTRLRLGTRNAAAEAIAIRDNVANIIFESTP